ncbi:hypothetical protein KKG37_01355, partial [Patescibacteria group bacterium]|nr:hypothetical protein [Patescibacteria group bacterium]
KKVLYFVIVLIVIVLGLFVFNKILKEKIVKVPEIPNATNEEIVDPNIVSVNEIIAPDQAPGREVFIEKASFKTDGDGGFVVISLLNFADATSTPTRTAIGVSQYFALGTILENFIVNLIEDLDEDLLPMVGDTVVASLYKKADQPNLEGEIQSSIGLGEQIVDEQGKHIEVFFKIIDNLETIPGFESKL